LVLKEVGARLNDACRPTDVVARLGGDEFAVLVRPVADVNTARMMSERIMLALEQPCLIRGIPVGIGASVGVSVFPQNGKDVDELMQRADVAMYAAKHDGGGIREYDPGHGRQSTGRLGLLSELSEAIEHDQLRLEFQPKVHLSTGACDSVEALVRWEHPVLGTIRPDQFVPMAEHTELMEPMTDWVIATALEYQRQWADAGVPNAWRAACWLRVLTRAGSRSRSPRTRS
jgi:predicted signal transduction protein with EAL and GGDEF domain